VNHPGPDIEANMMLCDFASMAGGKLFIHGGGWDRILVPEPEVSLMLATVLTIPWHLTNRPLQIEITLLSEDGAIVQDEEESPVVAGGELTVGRPAQVRSGMSQNVPLVSPFKPLPLAASGYVFTLAVDNVIYARTAFQVLREE